MIIEKTPPNRCGIDDFETPTYREKEDFCIRHELIDTSDPQTKSSNYTLSRSYRDYPDRPTKYLMIRLLFADEFSETERDRIVDIFQKMLEITKGYGENRNLWSDNPFAFFNTIDSPTRLIDKSRPYVTSCTRASIVMDNNDPTFLLLLYLAMLTNFLPGENDEYCRAAPKYFPIFLHRFEKNKDPDGSWLRANAPIYDHFFNTHTWLININATALDKDGESDRSWAASMFHEIMHNIGWRHLDGYDDRRQFILAAQDAFFTCGRD